MWYALNDNKAEYEYSFNYQNWYPSVEHECKNTIENVGLFELSPFSKYEIKGEKAYEELQRLCTANIKNEIGKCTYTHMLNEGAGIETDLTVVCLEKNHFRIISSAAVRTHDKAHILKHLSKDLEFKDVTDDIICLGIFGPKSRDLLSKITKEDITNENFKFGTSKNIKLNSTDVWTQRLSYVGELGYELYIPIKDAKGIYNLIINTGKQFRLSHCGAHAMDTMRMESGFLHWGHDISPEENQYEAGLNFAISYKKNLDFVGKKALKKIKQDGIKRKQIGLEIDCKPLTGPNTTFWPLKINDQKVGKITSAVYSPRLKKNIALAMIEIEQSEIGTKLEVITNEGKYNCEVVEKPFYDPKKKIASSS